MTWRPGRGFRVGAMRDFINIQSHTVDASSGQPIRSWSNLHVAVPAQWQPVSGGETVRGRQVEAGINDIFIIRHKNGLSTDMRVIHAATNTTYGIVSIIHSDGGIRYLELHCKAIPVELGLL